MPLKLPANNPHLRSVLMATDFSEASEAPLHHALAIARHYRARFYLTTVVPLDHTEATGPESVSKAEYMAWSRLSQLGKDLVARGALEGLESQIFVRHGRSVWQQLHEVVTLEEVDLIVIGTHGRHGVGKMILGSTAEEIFRSADCMVLTVGPSSYRDSRIEAAQFSRSFLYATDFGEASLCALPQAVSFANHFGARLFLMHVEPILPMEEGPRWYTFADVERLEDSARAKTTEILKSKLEASKSKLILEPGFIVEFGFAAERILDAATKLDVDLIILGVHHSRHLATISRMPWATAYDVACRARCPVLTVRN